MKITRVRAFLMASFTLAAVSSIRAETFTVGDAINWTVNPTFNYTDWAKNTSAKVGDSLEFTYNAERHDVRRVTEEEYDACDLVNYLEAWTSGADTVLLNSSGTWYFLCSKPGQKFSIDVAPAVPLAANSPTPAPIPSLSRSPSQSPPPPPSPSPPSPPPAPSHLLHLQVMHPLFFLLWQDCLFLLQLLGASSVVLNLDRTA
ncbi:hypothetical protein R1flu_006214 [Riccia fluitans]|uniref:Phytocyanin domain-containing protein n=1 Tax=Riccia fluitans TaxID=41844 RepID=A0ABD1YW88_9MARC